MHIEVRPAALPWAVWQSCCVRNSIGVEASQPGPTPLVSKTRGSLNNDYMAYIFPLSHSLSFVPKNTPTVKPYFPDSPVEYQTHFSGLASLFL